jgi:hypothetical protein
MNNLATKSGQRLKQKRGGKYIDRINKIELQIIEGKMRK